MRTAILHPWFLNPGGGEKVAEVIAEIFPDADIFCIYADAAKLPNGLKGRRISTSFLNKFPFRSQLHFHYMPFYPYAIESLDVSGYDLLISACAPVLMGVNQNQNATHVCYCHTPGRAWWDLYSEHQHRGPAIVRPIFLKSAHKLRIWETSAIARVDRIASNSSYVAQRVHQYFRRPSEVIYPPVDTSRGYISSQVGDYFLTVGRLGHQKKTEILIEACNRLGKKLVVVGQGRESAHLHRIAGPTIEMLGFVETEHLLKLYANCSAFLFAADEDFGIAPVEAQSFGRPVIAYGHGGSLETVRVGALDGSPDTGVFFGVQTVESVVLALQQFDRVKDDFDPVAIRQHALRFDTEVFKERFAAFVNSSVDEVRNERVLREALAMKQTSSR